MFCAKFVDKIGSEICSAVGLAGLAFLPELFKEPFIGIILSVVIYAIGSGLIEVLVSPIVEACPLENKDAVMSLLHSFYCWGSVGVIVLSTIFLIVFSIEQLVEDEKTMGIKGLLKVPTFWIAIILMICAGASELSMAQWASAYTESAIGLPKIIGDLAGPCMFAVMMGISRVIYGKYGDKFNLMKFILELGILCLVCYFMVALSANSVIGLIGCITCGFFVGIMWPGTISISSAQLPADGTAMFALLAMAGDLDGAFGPSLVGNVTQNTNDNLQAGMLAGCIFPLVLVICIVVLKYNFNRQK